MMGLRFGLMTGVAIAAAAGVLMGVSGPAAAQDKHEFAGQFLTNQQGELCTMCEADVVCTPETPPATAAPTEPAATDAAATDAVAPETAPANKTTLHFQKRGFFGQMSTVLDYFPFTRKFGLYHSRDVDIKNTGDAAPTRMTAKFDLETKRIDILDAAGKTAWWIDRADGSWRNADNSVRGACILLGR